MIHKPGTCGGVCNTPLHIRIKKSIPFYSLIRKLGTRGYEFNRYIPKRDTYLWDAYLLIPILDEDGVTQKPLNRPPGTRGGVCNTPLHIRIKNLIPFYPLNRPPGTREYVFNRYIPGMTWIG